MTMINGEMIKNTTKTKIKKGNFKSNTGKAEQFERPKKKFIDVNTHYSMIFKEV